MGAPKPLDRDVGTPTRFEQEMDAAFVCAFAGKIGMVGAPGGSSVAEYQYGLDPFHKRPCFADIGMCAAPLDLLPPAAINDDPA